MIGNESKIIIGDKKKQVQYTSALRSYVILPWPTQPTTKPYHQVDSNSGHEIYSKTRFASSIKLHSHTERKNIAVLSSITPNYKFIPDLLIY